MTSGIVLDWEVADSIALSVMVDHHKMIKQQMTDHRVNKTWMHPEDVVKNMEVLDATKVLIEYFGGNVNDK